MKLLGRAEWSASDGEAPALKGASPAARALFALASRFGPHPPLTGIYQALGREKLALTHHFEQYVTGDGFTGMRATDPLLKYTGYGSCVSLAIALGCRGPFWTLEADQLAGGAALQQALTDLDAGRCERALVCSSGLQGSAFLLVLGPGGSARATFTWSASRHDPAPDDLHGVRALGEALERQGGEVCMRTPEHRGLTVRFQ